jgi:hypothetical protein
MQQLYPESVEDFIHIINQFIFFEIWDITNDDPKWRDLYNDGLAPYKLEDKIKEVLWVLQTHFPTNFEKAQRFLDYEKSDYYHPIMMDELEEQLKQAGMTYEQIEKKLVEIHAKWGGKIYYSPKFVQRYLIDDEPFLDEEFDFDDNEREKIAFRERLDI